MASPYDNIPGKIFIGGIPPVTSQETIQRYFGQFGELMDCVLMQDKATGKSRGFGFVTYKDSHSVDQVLSTTHSIDGKEVDCKRAIPRDQQGDSVKEETSSSKTRKLFVGGLPQTISEEQFRGYFEQFGTIEDSVIMVDKDSGKSRGFGFVTFDSEEAVDRVIQRYYDNKIDGKWVECKRAQPKDIGAAAPTKKFGGGKPGKDYQGGGGKSQGYYQDSGSQKSSKSHYSQDAYDAGGFPANPNYMQGYPDYGPSGYGYNMGYPGDPNYGNMYAGYYNNPYGGAYNPAYGQYPQGQFGPMGYGADPNAAGQMGYPRGGMPGGPGGYNNMQGPYGGMPAQGSGSGAYGGKDRQQSGNGNYNKYKDNGSQQQSQAQSSQQMNLSPKDSTTSVGPAKPSATMQQNIESRYYTPY